MVVEHADGLRVTALPPEDYTPLIVDPDRMKIPQITAIGRIVQIEQLPSRLPTDLWWKPPCFSGFPLEK